MSIPQTEVNNGAVARRYRRPLYDVESNNDGYQISVLMPGVAKEGVTIALHGRSLEIDGARHDRPQDSWRPVVSELNWDDYRLRLELNVLVNESAIAAQVTDGVLRLTLPKAEEAKARRIDVA